MTELLCDILLCVISVTHTKIICRSLTKTCSTLHSNRTWCFEIWIALAALSTSLVRDNIFPVFNVNVIKSPDISRLPLLHTYHFNCVCDPYVCDPCILGYSWVIYIMTSWEEVLKLGRRCSSLADMTTCLHDNYLTCWRNILTAPKLNYLLEK